MTSPDISFMNCELPPFHAISDVLLLSECNQPPMQSVSMSVDSSSGFPVEILDDVTNEIPMDNLVYAGITIDDSQVMSEAIDQVFSKPKIGAPVEPLWTTHYWNNSIWVEKAESESKPRMQTLRAKLGVVKKKTLISRPVSEILSDDPTVNLPFNLKIISLTKIKFYHTYCHTQNAIYCFNKIAEYVKYIGSAKTVFDIDAFVGSIKITLKFYQSDILTSKRQNKLLQEIIKLFTVINNNPHIKHKSLNRYERRTATKMFGKFSDIFEMFDLDSELIYTCQLFL